MKTIIRIITLILMVPTLLFLIVVIVGDPTSAGGWWLKLATIGGLLYIQRLSANRADRKHND